MATYLNALMTCEARENESSAAGSMDAPVG